MNKILLTAMGILVGTGLGTIFGSIYNQLGLGLTLGGTLGLVASRLIPKDDMNTEEDTP